jgi:hypothetical protein
MYVIALLDLTLPSHSVESLLKPHQVLWYSCYRVPMFGCTTLLYYYAQFFNEIPPFSSFTGWIWVKLCFTVVICALFRCCTQQDGRH